ncbi:MAG: cobyrinate a,c-diamide synthase [Candidatus Velthaea sp.]
MTIFPQSNAYVRPTPRIVLGAAKSDSGKTTIALGLVAALRRRGYNVAAAKVGPDFIDAAHLSHASGRAARNLDAWLAPEAVVVDSFARGYAGADTVIIEGVMGLFDGRHGSGEGSTAHVARLLDAPVVLVLDCSKSSTTIGAVAYGLARYDARIKVAGAILNHVASERHAATVTAAVAAAGIPVLGVIRRDNRLALDRRHLGLVEPGSDDWHATLAAIADTVERDVDVDAVLCAARDVPALPVRTHAPRVDTRVRVALARDEAFWFYDEASLDALNDGGAEIVCYSPLRDPFPDVDAAFIGGGYPEVHAAGLEKNAAARNGLREAIAAGMPVYAECGGLMYLGESLATAAGTFGMVGSVPGAAVMSERRSALRYVQARTLADGPMFAGGDDVRGHEFHYSTMRYSAQSPAFAFDGEAEGYIGANVHASYVHVHLGAQQHAVDRFLAGARAFGSRN